MFQFNVKYFSINLFLLAALIVIAVFVKELFLQSYISDVLIIFWFFFLLKSFLKVANYELAHYALLFAFVLEIAQFYQVIELLELQDNKIAQMALGSAFDWFDLLAFAVGWLVILVIESNRLRLYKMSYRID